MSGAAVASPEFVGRPGAVLERLNRLYPSLIDLSLGRVSALLARLGHPERELPPVVHVAGTNGKGSVCANLRAIGEAAGLRVHVATSPHLMDVTERFRIAGRLVSENALVATLEEIERVNDGAAITVFEVLTAASFLLFSQSAAELAVIEVGLGGRFDATNVLAAPACSVITAISMDHEAFLGDSIAKIAGEKAGIIKPGRPVVSAAQRPEALAVLEEEAARAGSPLWLAGRDWSVEPRAHGLRYTDAHGTLELPPPALAGAFQAENSGLAVAASRAGGFDLPQRAWQGIGQARWPARLQHLDGRLADLLPAGWELWLDGGHNPGAGEVLSALLAGWHDRPLHLVVGMKQSKDARGFLSPLLDHADSLLAVAEPGQHMALPVEAIIAASGGRAEPGPTVETALRTLAGRATGAAPARVLICGSLYLAGEVLKADGWIPD